MAGTYQPIATYTANGSQNTITFSSLGSYTDIYLVANISDASGSGYFALRFSGDTTSTYSATFMYGNGSTGSFTASGTYLNLGSNLTGDNNRRMLMKCNLLNGSNSTTNKTVIFRSDDGNDRTLLGVGLWRSTSPITSITFFVIYGQNFNSTSTVSIYGIQGA